MTQYIRLQEGNCRNCLRCVRICPTKAMTYIDHQPKIIEDECILCGKCYSVCPHSAKKVNSDFQSVKKWLEQKEKVVLSVAPSFVAIWPKFKQLEKVLLEKGFYLVEETAIGAKIVSESYSQLLVEGKMKNIISTCCPAVVSLVEKEYGDLVDQLAPIVSPMIAHGIHIKERYPDAKVVFLSPCIAKQKEKNDERFNQAIDATISMADCLEFIGNIEQDDTEWEDFEGSIARLYPTPGGILKTLPREINYKKVNVEGVERIKQVLNSIRNDMLEGYFFEMSACHESCMGGPLLTHCEHNEWLGQSVIRNSVDENKKINAKDHMNTYRVQWENENIQRNHHTDEEIQDMLYMMGKTNIDKELNCGACGYETCRDKAIAVLDGKADPKICLPNALEHAESISSLIIENTPNGIIVLDENRNILEINPSAKLMLDLENVNVVGLPLYSVLPDNELIELVNTVRRVQYHRAAYPQYHRTFDHAIMKLEEGDYVVLILMDLTVEETKEKVMKQIRQQTVEITQQVIDDQMRTVQEIASLLGETTAKSKVALTRLKKAMDEDE
ncbi:[Fe-Fe] hydrogenase large subunit C-terminal domain-containing protein [Anaerorhabdus furcosa]|uniref:Iron only hydrogenase large subunit, C-terminal domain n=1 Tax=Anaerorhabdus furcosa TaxID=118967 RepID=A0A1T4LMR3_9FIRM|nr:[Fe-Fe] hydrogenase large subunit C-terminal domain-containing protein [Anaerorhabdus furcosa]SJZ56040.1 Iron only hydrogenase large subunit, C-terminal domain [Anaerorhabdus furcosa]